MMYSKGILYCDHNKECDSPLTLIVVGLNSLIGTERSNVDYIAAKFYQQIQFFSLKMQKSGGLVLFPRTGTVQELNFYRPS